MAQEGSSKGIRWGWIIAGLLVLTIAIGFALKAVEGSFQYYLTADEYAKKRESLEGRYVKIAGVVKSESHQKKDDTHYFVVEFGGAEIPVAYAGITPDTFKEGVEVVVEGRSPESGDFVANNVMAKCASKYEVGNMPSLDQQSP